MKYNIRSRKKPQRLVSPNIVAQVEDSSSLNEFTPASKRTFSLKQLIGSKLRTSLQSTFSVCVCVCVIS